MAQEHALPISYTTDVSFTSGQGLEEFLPADVQINLADLRYGYVIGGMHFLVEKQLTSEVICKPQVFAVPLAPTWFSGLTNSHGTIVPVYDLAGIFDVSSEPSRRRSHVLVLDKGENAIGLMVSDLPQALKKLELCHDIGKLPSSVLDFVSGALHIPENDNKKIWHEFDHKRFIQQLISQHLYF